MTNNEIEKLLNLLSLNDLEKTKEYLLKQKENNNKNERQRAFEKYLTTNMFGYNAKRCPKIFVSDECQKFTNWVSLYVINKDFFRLHTPKLVKACAKGTRYNHRFDYSNNEFLDNAMGIMEKLYGKEEYDCLDIWHKDDLPKTSLVDYMNIDSSRICTEKFDNNEINTARLILKEPKFTISTNLPLIKGESDIGKCYILGFKRGFDSND